MSEGSSSFRMAASPWLFQFLRSFEKFAPRVYKDSGGVPTIGYGHVIRPGETYSQITREEAEALLRDDIGLAAGATRALVTVPLTGYQEDALVSFVFNVGQTAFSTSTMRQLLNQGKYLEAAHEFRRWSHTDGKESAGLLRRRIAEELRFLGGHEQSCMDIADRMLMTGKRVSL